MRPRTDNSIEQGSGNTQIGHNTGEIKIGLTFEQHQQALKEALADKTADLERAHGAEKDLLRREADELQRRLSEVEPDYNKRLEELAKLKAELAEFQNGFEKEKFDAANAALDRDDTSLAEALFKELLKGAEARREDAERDEAGLHYHLGKIAENAVRWTDAYTHYKRAAHLSGDIEYLEHYGSMCLHLAKGTEAVRVFERLVVQVNKADGPDSESYACALNNLAAAMLSQGSYAKSQEVYQQALDILRAQGKQATANYIGVSTGLGNVLRLRGHFKEAEELFRQELETIESMISPAYPGLVGFLNNFALVLESQGKYFEAEGLYRRTQEMIRDAVGEMHPDFARALHNLAAVIRLQKRYKEAEELSRQALGIVRDTIGEMHPIYAIYLNNLGLGLINQKRYALAEKIHLKALRIDQSTIGKAHPDYATHLNNLALVVEYQKRYDEAERLYLEVLEMVRNGVGEAHADYATSIGNLGRLYVATNRVPEARELMKQALAIFRAALREDHPKIREAQRRLDALPSP